MPEKILGLIPFLLTVDGKYRLNPTRIVEAVIISLLGGALAGYIALQKMEVKFDLLQRSVVEMKDDLREIRRDVYVPRGG